jgi:hypothetical protein
MFAHLSSRKPQEYVIPGFYGSNCRKQLAAASGMFQPFELTARNVRFRTLNSACLGEFTGQNTSAVSDKGKAGPCPPFDH